MYNQVSFDSDEIAELVEDLDHRIDERACQCPICTHDVVMSPGDVAIAARRLNDGKRDGSGLFSMDHILHADKSQLLLFNPGQHREISPVCFSGVFVSQSTEAVHLGHLISFDSKLPPIRSAEDLTKLTNILASKFRHCGLEVKYCLYSPEVKAFYICMLNFGVLLARNNPWQQVC
ncbi:hypothetical protein CAPTEDRAFT_192628, partial [Capitella teleta]